MRYAQIKSGNKLHLVYEIPGGLTQPICGTKTNGHGFRATFNVPLNYACINCQKVINGKNHEMKKFVRPYFD